MKKAPELWASEPGALPGQQRIRARIAGLHCSLCTSTIEKALGRMDGVGTVAVSLTHEQALVDYDPALIGPDQILGTLRDVGYELYDPRKLRPFEEEEEALVREGGRLLAAVTASLTAIGLIAAVTGVFSVLVPATVVVVMVPLSYALLRPAGRVRALTGAAAVVAPGVAALVLRATGVLAGPVIGWVAGVMAAVAVFGVAPHILRMAYQSARRGILNQHVLLEAGAFAGIVGGLIGLGGWLPDYPTAAFFAVTVLITNYHIFSEWLSLLVKTRSSQSVRKLLDLQPDLAWIVTGNGDEAEVPVEHIAVGDLVRVRPGERVPLDGRIREGHSSLDLALVTGEPVPVGREPGGEVISGAINGTGSLLVEVTATSAEGFLAQVVRHVEYARALKPGILHLVDRVLRVYTPTILTLSLLALAVWLAGSWAVTGEADVRRAVFAALSVLVMGYPCAVGIAAPLAIVRGTGAAADRGIVMRTGEAFQTFRQVRRIVLDKTGTLTEGKPVVIGIEAVTGTAGQLLALAAGAERHSEHPLARAVLTAADDQEVIPVAVTDFESVTGSGIRAIAGGKEVVVGSPAFLSAAGINLTPLSPRIDQWEAAGSTVIAVAQDRQLKGLIALADRIRPDATAAVAAMRAAGMEPVMVTGDNERAARHVGHELGITDIRAGVRPEGKAVIVRELQAGGIRVAMVGDGINDAPALMQADVGIAAGGGTDIAIESADIVLLRHEVGAVLDARTISDAAYRRTRANVALAFVFNGVGVPLAASGMVYPVWAMAAMAASVTAIFLNSIGTRPALLFDAIRSVKARHESDADGIYRDAAVEHTRIIGRNHAVTFLGIAWQSLLEAFFMFWGTLWALVFGFTLSGAVQAFVSRQEMQKAMGDHRPTTILRTGLLGAASSSCSYAATALAKSLFQRGADFTTAMVFMIASTNLVVELGAVLWLLIGWQFALAEFVGGTIMIVLFVLIGPRMFPAAELEQARAMLNTRSTRQEHPDESDAAERHGVNLWHRLGSKAGWANAAGYAVSDV